MPLPVSAPVAFHYPAPGLPQFLRCPSDPIELIATTRLNDPDLIDWTRTLSLVPAHPAPLAQLGDVRIEDLERDRPPALVAAALAVDSDRCRRLLRLHIECSAQAGRASSRRFDLYSLAREGETLRDRCVAFDRGGSGGQLSLAFASDLHVAAIWDTIDAAVGRYAADLHEGYLHPGRLLRRFVATANGLAARGELDLVVLGGDLVDHVRPDAHVTTSGSNVDHFLGLLADLTVPCCVIPGNHDFRLYPWRPRIYPYESVAIPPRRAAAVLRRAGLWDALPLRRSDLRALRTSDENGCSALAEHLTKLAPATDYRIDLDDISLTMLSTGRDVLPRWRTIERQRIGTLLRALPGSWEHPDSEGLDATQVAAIADAAQAAKGAAFFFHAPLFNPRPGVRVEDRIRRLDPGDRDGLSAAAAFERRLFRSGLRQGVFFRNPGPLVRALAGVRHAATVFSGHVHHTHALRFVPADLTVRSVDLPWVAAHERCVQMLNAPALGQTAMSLGEDPGYLRARFVHGRLQSAEMVPMILGG